MSSNKNKNLHKAKNRPFPGVTDDVIMGESISTSDERKTVILDEDLEGLEVEDKMWLYWKRNKNFIILTVAAVFLVVVGGQLWKVYKDHSFDSLASAYESAGNAQQLEEFARGHAGVQLAGIALLQNADALYAAKDYKQAADAYASAAKALGSNLLRGRALLGEGMSLSLDGNADAAKTAFKALSEDKSAQTSYRLEGAFNLALLEKLAGNRDSAKAILEGIVTDASGGAWGQLAQDALTGL